MSKIAQSGRTTVRFANPTGIKARIFTMDPADAIRANVYQETVLSKEPESGPNAPMFGAGMQSSSGVMGSMVLNDRMPTMEHCWGRSEPRPAGASYRLAQGQTYRVGIAEIEKPVSIGVSATLEVVAQDSKSEQYLSSNTISIAFTDEDFKNVMEAKTVIKIIYLRHAPHAENDGNGTGVQVSTYCGRGHGRNRSGAGGPAMRDSIIGDAAWASGKFSRSRWPHFRNEKKTTVGFFSLVDLSARQARFTYPEGVKSISPGSR